MRRVLFLIVNIILIINVNAQSSQPSLSGKQILTNFQYSINSGGQMDYYVYYPNDFDNSPTNRPILISIHGAAERGGSPTKILSDEFGNGSPAYLINKGKDLPLMVFSPHQQAFIGGVYNQTWNIELLKEFVEHIKSTYNIDENRIFITGFSNGAQAAWQYAVNYTEDVAALVPVAGRTDLSNQSFNVNLQESTYSCRLKDLPIQVWHGNNDHIIHYSHSENMVNSINQCTPTPDPLVALNLISGMDHDGLRPYVYENINGSNNIYDWFLQTTASEDVPDITAPVFLSQPAITQITTSSVAITGSINELGSISWGLYTQNQTVTVNELLSGNTAIQSGTISAGLQPFSINVQNLTSNTSYKIALIASDDEKNKNTQSTITSLPFTTKTKPVSGSGQKYQLNITKSGYNSGVSGWNDLAFDNISGIKSYSSFKSVDGVAAPFTLTAYSGAEGSTINAVADNGSTYGGGIFPANILRHTAYTSGTLARLVFRNMPKDKLYNISVIGSRKGTGSRLTKYTVNGKDKYLECIENKNNVVKFELTSPNSSGEISLDFSKSNAGWGYMNAIIIEEYVESPSNDNPPPVPNNMQANLIGLNNIEVDWSNSSAEDLAYYQLYRNDVLLVDLLSDSYYLDERLQYDTKYTYFTIAVDNAGNKSSASEKISLTTGLEPESSVSEKIQINFTSKDSPSNLSDWNEVSFDANYRQTLVYNLFDVNRNVTDKTLTVWNGENGSNINGFSNNGDQLNGGIYPNSVLQYAAYTSGQGICMLNGLNSNFVYDIEIHSGRSGTGSRKTIFEVNNSTFEIESINNNSNTVLFKNISPDKYGEIMISFAESNSGWGYLNAVVVTEKSTQNNARLAKNDQFGSIENVNVYPNPSKGNFTIINNSGWTGSFSVVVSNLDGDVLLSEQVNEGNSLSIKSQLTAGLYVLRIITETESVVRQIVISE